MKYIELPNLSREIVSEIIKTPNITIGISFITFRSIINLFKEFDTLIEGLYSPKIIQRWGDQYQFNSPNNNGSKIIGLPNNPTRFKIKDKKWNIFYHEVIDNLEINWEEITEKLIKI